MQDFLILLNFDVPQGYYAEVDQLNPNFRHFRHCSSVVIWLEPLQPESVPGDSSCDDEEGGSDDPDPVMGMTMTLMELIVRKVGARGVLGVRHHSLQATSLGKMSSQQNRGPYQRR